MAKNSIKCSMDVIVKVKDLYIVIVIKYFVNYVRVG